MRLGRVDIDFLKCGFSSYYSSFFLIVGGKCDICQVSF